MKVLDPLFEAIKILLSLAVTEGVGYSKGSKHKGMKLDFIDVRRAYFQARARRSVYVKLPDEDYEEGKVGKLLKSMYGTRACSTELGREIQRGTPGIGIQTGNGVVLRVLPGKEKNMGGHTRG